MAATSSEQELGDFLGDIRAAVNLVSAHAQIVRRPSPDGKKLTIEPVGNRSVGVKRYLWLGLSYTMALERGRYTTMHYRFTVQAVPENRLLKGTEWLVRWEYHPDTPPRFPHIHVNGAKPEGWALKGSLGELHFPASRAMLEDAVEFLIEEFDAARKPLKACQEVLAGNRARFEKRKTWLIRPPTGAKASVR